MKKKENNIVVVQPYGIGDTLFMLAFLKALKQQKKPDRIDVLIGPRTKKILENCPYIDDIIVIDKDKWKKQSKLKIFAEKIDLFFKLSKRRYSLFIDFSMQPEYSFWARFLLRIPQCLGFNYRRRNRFLTRSLRLPHDGFSKKHVIEYYCDLARMLSFEITDKKPEFIIPEQELVRAKNLLLEKDCDVSNFIVVSPGGGVSWGQGGLLRLWPIEYFAELAKKIKTIKNYQSVVVLGIEQEKNLGEFLSKKLSFKTINLCGQTDILTSAAIIKLSKLFLASDGGLVHVATSQDTPVIALYGPPDPVVYGPYPLKDNIAVLTKDLPCRPCYSSFRYNQDCPTNACLKQFMPEEVFGKLQQINYWNKIGWV